MRDVMFLSAMLALNVALRGTGHRWGLRSEKGGSTEMGAGHLRCWSMQYCLTMLSSELLCTRGATLAETLCCCWCWCWVRLLLILVGVANIVVVVVPGGDLMPEGGGGGGR